MKVLHWIRSAILYFGVGALLHAIVYSATLDWHSAWTRAWLLAWPAVLFLYFWVVVFWGLVAALVITGGVFLWTVVA
jgi:hypothetical protein